MTRDEASVGLHAPSRVRGWDRFIANNYVLTAIDQVIDEPVYIVGGSVRDLASGDVPNDLDITSSLPPQRFRAAMEDLGSHGFDLSVFDVGEEHGTTGVVFHSAGGFDISVEHTTHRTDRYEPGSRQPIVGFSDDLHEDLDRRDFTLNAVAVDLSDGSVVDPHGGLADLDAKILRTPMDPDVTFSDDPLRIARLVRFAAVRGYEIEPETATAASASGHLLASVSAERKRAELLKVMGGGTAATARALQVADELAIRHEVFCGLGDKATPKEISGLSTRGSEDLLAALAIRSSDPRTALKGLKFSNAEVASAVSAMSAIEHLERPNIAFRAAMRQWGSESMGRANRISVGLGERGSAEHIMTISRLRQFEGFDTQPLPVNGHDAVSRGLRGTAVGAALKRVEQAMCANPRLTRAEAMRTLDAEANR